MFGDILLLCVVDNKKSTTVAHFKESSYTTHRPYRAYTHTHTTQTYSLRNPRYSCWGSPPWCSTGRWVLWGRWRTPLWPPCLCALTVGTPRLPSRYTPNTSSKKEREKRRLLRVIHFCRLTTIVSVLLSVWPAAWKAVESVTGVAMCLPGASQHFRHCSYCFSKEPRTLRVCSHLVQVDSSAQFLMMKTWYKVNSRIIGTLQENEQKRKLPPRLPVFIKV